MARLKPSEILERINSSILDIEVAGGELTIPIEQGSPDYRVISFRPLAVEKYGLLRRRAPSLVGEFGVKGFFWKEIAATREVYPYMVIDSGREMYGCNVGENIIGDFIAKLEIPIRLI